VKGPASSRARQLPEAIRTPRTDPVYNCHAYLTKVPLAAIAPFIEAFTEPGQVVADFFAGSGMTGLAALTLNRNARMSDISVLGRHIFTGYVTSVPAKNLAAAAHQVVAAAKEALGSLYAAKRASDGHRTEMIRTVWSFTYRCPGCEAELVYFHHVDGSGRPPRVCPSCGEPFARRAWPRGEDVPVQVVVRGEDGRQAEQEVCETDLRNLRKAARDPRLKEIPSRPIEPHREMYGRSGLGRSGMTETAKFFSPRNAIGLLELWAAINATRDDAVRQALRFAFTAILPRASRRYQWGPKRPLNAQNQTYYIAPVYYEWNVFDLFLRKVNAVAGAHVYLFDRQPLFTASSTAKVAYDIASADRLAHLGDESVDYVFIDPPFGSNIFYSDMNLFHEAWLGELTSYQTEAVVYTTGKRSAGAQDRYEQILRESFKEGWRILKPGSHMTVVFGNSNGRIWGLVQRALRDAGFNSAPVHVATLDKGQRSVKGLNSGSESVVTIDLILTFRKPPSGEKPVGARTLESGDTRRLIEEAIRDLPPDAARSPSQVYTHVLMKAIQKRLALDDLHLGDVLIALRNAGYEIDRKHGVLVAPATTSAVRPRRAVERHQAEPRPHI
jgi:16S rRNA G966 N2-methylase RsmD